MLRMRLALNIDHSRSTRSIFRWDDWHDLTNITMSCMEKMWILTVWLSTLFVIKSERNTSSTEEQRGSGVTSRADRYQLPREPSRESIGPLKHNQSNQTWSMMPTPNGARITPPTLYGRTRTQGHLTVFMVYLRRSIMMGTDCWPQLVLSKLWYCFSVLTNEIDLVLFVEFGADPTTYLF